MPSRILFGVLDDSTGELIKAFETEKLAKEFQDQRKDKTRLERVELIDKNMGPSIARKLFFFGHI